MSKKPFKVTPADVVVADFKQGMFLPGQEAGVVTYEPEYVTVKVAPELVEKLATEDSEPVVIIGLDKQADGTYEMVLRSCEMVLRWDRDRLYGIAGKAAGEAALEHGRDGSRMRTATDAFLLSRIARAVVDALAPGAAHD